MSAICWCAAPPDAQPSRSARACTCSGRASTRTHTRVRSQEIEAKRDMTASVVQGLSGCRGRGKPAASSGPSVANNRRPAMTSIRHMKTAHQLVLGAALLATAGGLLAQASGLTRTLVGRADVSVPGREAVVARVEVAPGAKAGRHTHPGDEISYVMEGEATLLVDGEPARTVKAGESFVIPAGIIHDAHNNTASP